ncbi:MULTISPECIES: hypothetical protein [Rodentibacter]|uniref:hypothetical protein n=1 Tax=Rodentibacter TaxID=1960084 RepID=UPI001CFC8046|nr:hypothetical protein [Rodentibacter sp. JRC1]GJI55717.1 hypothetical protein HEMROJRC1_08290 [Rodentibacter sp. JRC1]
MKELALKDLVYVSGGSWCEECNGPDPSKQNKSDYKYENPVNFGPIGGPGTTVGSLIGGRLGWAGSVAGSAAEYVLYDSIDYNKVGNNYVGYVTSELKNGNIPAD